jgi:hypothetical protein
MEYERTPPWRQPTPLRPLAIVESGGADVDYRRGIRGYGKYDDQDILAGPTSEEITVSLHSESLLLAPSENKRDTSESENYDLCSHCRLDRRRPDQRIKSGCVSRPYDVIQNWNPRKNAGTDYSDQ